MIALNRRRVMTISENPTLPYDYEVKWLQSTGTQYIDTGVLLDNNSSWDLTFLVTQKELNPAVIGARQGYANKDFSWAFLEDFKLRRDYGTQSNSSSGAFFKGAVYNYKASANKIIDSNGNIMHTFSSQTFQCPVSAYIFDLNNNGASFKPYPFRIYSCSMSGRNKSVDLIPVVKDNVGYMYDKVSGQLLPNSGTGAFIIGPKAEVPYTRVEYLKSNSLAWIDTGVSGDNDNLIINATWMIEKWVNNGSIYSNLNGDINTTRMVLTTSGSKISAGINTDYNHEVSGTISKNTKYTTVAIRGSLYVGNTTTTGTPVKKSTNSRNIVLFNRASDNIIERDLGMRLYSFSIEDNTGVLLDMVPVRIGQTGYMYDYVSEQLFGNGGTGSFTLGPDMT